MVEGFELEENLTLEQKVQLSLLEGYISKLNKTRNYRAGDMFRDPNAYMPDDFAKDMKDLYSSGVLPKEIITEKFSEFLMSYSKRHPRYAKLLYNAFLDEFKEYERSKKK